MMMMMMNLPGTKYYLFVAHTGQLGYLSYLDNSLIMP